MKDQSLLQITKVVIMGKVKCHKSQISEKIKIKNRPINW